MQKRNFKRVTITSKGEKSVLNGHPWIYVGEVLNEESGISNGELVDVINEKGKYLGTGFYNHNSKIIIRLISKNPNDKFDYDFYKRRVEYAWNYRKTVMPNDLNSIRVIYGEADELPGLTVDKFNDILVVQILSLGIDLNKDIIFKALMEVFTKDNILINAIYEREDVPIRELEGLKEFTGYYDIGKEIPSTGLTQIIENGIKYNVDYKEGQKTGYFLDQKYNRLKVRNISKNKKVLDCCTHTGSFAMNAYLGGAQYVKALDISEKALEDAQNNFKLNAMDIDTECGDIFEILKKLSEEKTKSYDFIILDPPAFTKSRKTINSALKGYEEINYLAMKSLPRGGFLATASCSHFATYDLFKKALVDASIKAGVTLKLVSFSSAAPDHPIIMTIPETEYLKFFIFQII